MMVRMPARRAFSMAGGTSGRAGSIMPNRPRKTRLRSEEHTSELQSLAYLVCRLLLEKKKGHTDSLTAVIDHRYFHGRLRAELHRARRPRETVGVLMVDIDDFKPVNDVRGHDTTGHVP